MAFHQPTRQVPQRAFRPAHPDEETPSAPQPTSPAVEESQTWVLFPPPTEDGTVSSYLTSPTANPTPGRSRLSDLGSLDTVARSGDGAHQDSPTSEDALDDNTEDEDAELDSLDSHLPGFRSNPNYHDPTPQGLQHTAPVVPAHDGLGSFRLDQEPTGPDFQARLYAFEQYNPQRVKRRRESLDLAQDELDEQDQEAEKMRRIEAWRLEQSRLLLEEVQKETRRQRRSVASAPSVRRMSSTAEDLASMSAENADQGEAWHEQNAAGFEPEHETERESVWDLITRKVVRDFLGIDDKMLAILYGEALPDEEDLSSTPKASFMQQDWASHGSTDTAWHIKMLERVAKELGSLVNQLSGHPGSFSTFTRMSQTPTPYAGLPPIPETAADPEQSMTAKYTSNSIPEFQPTVGTQTRPIEVLQRQFSHDSAQSGPHHGHREGHGAGFSADEWEQELDVRLIFRYLRSRFMPKSGTTTSSGSHSHAPQSSPQDLAAKVARVRQYHPVTARLRPVERRTFKATTPTSPVLFRPGSSCASQSARRSARRSSCSSRHYWDIGAGSVGTGSLIAATGPMGSWGEI